MRFVDKVLFFIALTVSLAATTFGATITGSVKGPDGKPFTAAFVIAENTQNKMTVSVLSDPQGRYHIGNLPAATYSVRTRAIGYTSDPQTGVQLTGDQKASFDFALHKGTVRWSDLNTFQGTQLLPKTKSHDVSKRYQDTFFVSCFSAVEILDFSSGTTLTMTTA